MTEQILVLCIQNTRFTLIMFKLCPSCSWLEHEPEWVVSSFFSGEMCVALGDFCDKYMKVAFFHWGSESIGMLFPAFCCSFSTQAQVYNEQWAMSQSSYTAHITLRSPGATVDQQVAFNKLHGSAQYGLYQMSAIYTTLIKPVESKHNRLSFKSL